MKVPLIARTFTDVNGNQKVEIWSNSRKQVVAPRFKPYFLSYYKMNLPYTEEDVIERIFLSDLKKHRVYKYSFKNTSGVSNFRDSDSIEADIIFTDRILIDDPDFFLQFPNVEPLRILYFDIETDVEDAFPIPDRNAVIAIGCRTNTGKGKLFVADSYDDDCEIISDFFEFMNIFDPDILVTYNGDHFDIPYLMKRMEIHGIPLGLWSRDNTKPESFKGTIRFGGRVSFDIWKQVERDQTLYGIKNRQMKTVAKWIDTEGVLDIIEVERTNMRDLVNTKELREYLKSDVRITEFLFDVYSKNVFMLAEMNKIPLNLMINASPSFLPRIIHGRAFQKLGIVSDKNNAKRYPEHIKNKQGAIVDTYKPGLYRKSIWKVDFTSQYPNIVRNFNISPETTRIVEYKRYTGEYKFYRDGSFQYFEIPDERFGKNVVIQVDMSRQGFLSKFVSDILDERFSIKKRMKEIDRNSTEYEYLHVRQNSLKVLANIQTGYQGQEHARFGSLACYVLITGMGRWYARNMIKRLGQSVISVDTDGIYVDTEPDLDEINDYLDRLTEETFDCKNYLHMDMEEYDAAFFRETKGKHYILKKGDKLIFHGASFKGSRVPKFWDRILEEVARKMFNGERISEKDIDLTQFDLADLTQSIRVQSKSSYKNKNSLPVQLIRQFEEEVGSGLMEDDQLSYIKTKNGYELYIPGKEVHGIDWKYYRKIVQDIFDRLGIEDRRQMTFAEDSF